MTVWKHMTVAYCCHFVVACIFADSTAKAKDPPALRPSIVEDYRKALAVLEAHYTRIKGDGVEFHVGPFKSDRTIRMRVFHYSRNDERYKYEHEYGMSQVQNGAIQSFPQYVHCVTPEEYFSLRKAGKKEAYRLGTHRRPPAATDKRNFSWVLWPFSCTYSTTDFPISSLLNSIDYILANEIHVVVDGRSLVSLRFELIPGHEKNSSVLFQSRYSYPSVSLLISPSERYVLRGFTLEAKHPREPFPVVVTGKIEYVGTYEGFPIPERVVEVALEKTGAGTKLTLGDGSEAIGEVARATTYVIKNVSFTPDPESAFTLGAFGIQVEAKPPVEAKSGGRP